MNNIEMIVKFPFFALRNSEYFQFVTSAKSILSGSDFAVANFDCLIKQFEENIDVAEAAFATEKKNEKIREKNDADSYRDRLHGKLFNYVKSILYDERDPRFNDAQTIMRVLKEAGNPTKLSENAQSAMMTALGNKLEPLRPQLSAIGAETDFDSMMEANRRFIVIEEEFRKIKSMQNLEGAVLSVSAARKKIDPVYRSIVAAINGFANVPSKQEECREVISDMNVLVARYDALLSARRKTPAEQDNADRPKEVTVSVEKLEDDRYRITKDPAPTNDE